MTSIAARAAAPRGIWKAFYTKRTLPTSAGWTAVAYNGSVWAALVGGSTQAATSTDGATWTSRTSSGSSNWSGMGAIGSTFVAVASGTSTYQTSTDGINWTSRTMPSSTNWTITHYSGSLASGVLAISADKTAWTTNGTSWTESAYASGTKNGGYWQIAGSAYNGTTWVLLKDNFTDHYFTSTNGTTWTQRNMPIPDQRYEDMGYYWGGISWTGTYWLAAFAYGGQYYRSTDAITWTPAATPSWIAPDGGKTAITPQYNPTMGGSNGATYYSVYRGGFQTLDGVTWVNRAPTLPYAYGFWNGAAYNSTTAVWVGNSGACVSGPNESPSTRR